MRVVEIHIRRNCSWEGARYCDGAFERTIQTDSLQMAIDELLRPFVQADLSEGTLVVLSLTFESK